MATWLRKDPDLKPPNDPVIVTGVDIPFWDLVKLQVKFAIAAIPAMFILIALGAIIAGAIGGLRK